MDKSPDAFRTISEVAEDLDLPQHVLRFWETRFNQIRPMKRGGGRRYYRPDDIELLRGIRHLLYGQGYTIKGVQRILKEQGARFVMEIGRNPHLPIPNERAGARALVPAGRTPVPSPVEDEPEAARFQDEADEAAFRAAEEAMDGEEEALPAGILPEAEAPRTGLRFMDRFRGGESHGGGASLSRDDIRRLQATLFELLECKRLLDQTR